ncbi:trigger factor [Prochlorococcus marinus]|uniref:trigger factor n=1 Tax=Prochlorococcus marinus TaxID=1219 RepID=UPI0022B2D129|nr:trigger factor [Prochlorococcus marinus]
MSNSQLKIKTKPLPNSRLAIELEVPAKQCKASYEEALSTLCRSANIPGFRKGKVPKAVILQQVGAMRIQASALEKLLEKVWKQALDEESIKPLCDPELANGFDKVLENFNPEKALSITLETDISPTPKLKTTKGLTAEVEPIKFNTNKVDELIEQSRKQLATVVPIDNRAASHGDIAVVSFKGTFVDDGSEIEGGSGEAMEIELEEGKMIPGFIEGIYGMKINDKKSLECIFPKEYQDEKAKGRKAKFDIELKDLKTRELPDLNDAFAKQAGDKETMLELRNDLTERLKKDNENLNQKKRQESILNSLVEQLEVELPKSLIDQEVRNLIEKTARNFADQGIDVKSTFTQEVVNSLMESSRPEAEANLRNSFALNALADAENIEVEPQELENKLEEIKKELASQSNIDQDKLRTIVADDLLQEKLFKWLEKHNTIIEKKPKNKSTKSEKKSTEKKTPKKSQKTNTNNGKTTKD